MNADILRDFLKRLIKDMHNKKVFLILDNLKVHHAKPVKAWLGPSVSIRSRCSTCRHTV
ncbi:MAG: hypothetical protein E5299_00119 [Burkholderia gladioli]|nr:MAG: hypothetical protein E5299_00119 [Burkholderia gladioli]